MRTEQKIRLELLREVVSICKQNDIEYFLSPMTSYVINNHLEKKSNHEIEVYMNVKNCKKFIKIFDKIKKQERDLESMNNNPYFPGFYLRYINSKTTLIDLNTVGCYRSQGIYITIQILRIPVQPFWQRMILNILEVGWIENTYLYRRKPNVVNLYCKILMRCLMLLGRKRIGKKLFRTFLNVYDGDVVSNNIKEYVIINGRKKQYFDIHVFSKKMNIQIEGHSYTVPLNLEHYHRETLQNSAINNNGQEETFTINRSENANFPYFDYLERVGSFKKIAKNAQRFYIFDVIPRRIRKYYMRGFKLAQIASDNYELINYLNSKKSYIINLYKNEDFVQLNNFFKTIHDQILDCLKCYQIDKIDEEIIQVYITQLSITGQREMLNRVKREVKI